MELPSQGWHLSICTLLTLILFLQLFEIKLGLDFIYCSSWLSLAGGSEQQEKLSGSFEAGNCTGNVPGWWWTQWWCLLGFSQFPNMGSREWNFHQWNSQSSKTWRSFQRGQQGVEHLFSWGRCMRGIKIKAKIPAGFSWAAEFSSWDVKAAAEKKIQRLNLPEYIFN